MRRERAAAHHRLLDAIAHAVALVDGEHLTLVWLNAAMAGWTGLSEGDSVSDVSNTVREDAVRSRMLRGAPIRFEGLYAQGQQHRAVSWQMRKLPGLAAWLLEGRDDTRLLRERSIAQAYVTERLRDPRLHDRDDLCREALVLLNGLVDSRITELRRQALMPLLCGVRWAGRAGASRVHQGLAAAGYEPIACGERLSLGMLTASSSQSYDIGAVIDRFYTSMRSDELRPLGLAAAVTSGNGFENNGAGQPNKASAQLLRLLGTSHLGELTVSARLGRHCGCVGKRRQLPRDSVLWSLEGRDSSSLRPTGSAPGDLGEGKPAGASEQQTMQEDGSALDREGPPLPRLPVVGHSIRKKEIHP